MRTIITWIFIVLTVGFLRLVFYWKPHWFLQCCCIRADLSVAQYVLLKVLRNQIVFDLFYKILGSI
jgi:cation-transporting ATPase 13A3/4/5